VGERNRRRRSDGAICLYEFTVLLVGDAVNCLDHLLDSAVASSSVLKLKRLARLGASRSISGVCTVWYRRLAPAKLLLRNPRCRFAKKEGIMETNRVEELRGELNQLLKKQTKVLESRTFGEATDTELLEYELRQEVIHEICNQLANSSEA